ncbi:hypothetical protein V5799_014181, partial [Amblyomma americanum]
MSKQTGRRSSTKKSRRKIGRGGSHVKAVTATTASHPAGSPIVSSVTGANDEQGTSAKKPSDKPFAYEVGRVSSPPIPAGKEGNQQELNAGISRDKKLASKTGVAPSAPIPAGEQENQHKLGDASPIVPPAELAAVENESEAASPPTESQARSPMSTIIARTFANNKRTTLTIVAGAAAFAIVSFIIFLAVSSLLSNTREFCLTEDCVRHTTLLTEYLDSTRDPCNNFR